MYMVVWMWHMCVLCTPGALVIRTASRALDEDSVICGILCCSLTWQILSRYGVKWTLFFCFAEQVRKKKTMPWCNASQLSAQWIWEKDHKTFSTEKPWRSWWLSRTSISNYIFFFLSFFIQTIVQYLQINALYLQHFVLCLSLSW